MIFIGGRKFGSINSLVVCRRDIELKRKLSILLIKRINILIKNKIYMYFFVDEKWCIDSIDYWFELIEVKVEYLLGFIVLSVLNFI